MTMKRSLASVRDALAELNTAVREIAVAVDDSPAVEGDLAVIDALRAHAVEVEGDVSETAAAAGAALQAEEAGDGRRAACLLADAHERFCALTRRVQFDLSGHASLFEIERLPERRGNRWRGWSDVALRQLEQVDHTVHRVHEAFVGCWQEVVERGAAAVSVTSTQKIAVDPPARQKRAAAL